TSAPEHVLNWHDHSGTCGDGAFNDRICVAGLQCNARACSSQCLRRPACSAFLLSKLVAQEQFVTVENNLTLHHSSSVRLEHHIPLVTAEGLLVELQGGFAVAYDQVRNKLIFSTHRFSCTVC